MKSSIILCILVLGVPLQLLADSSDVAALQLSPVVVIASKVARPIADVAGSVTVISAADIEANLAHSLDDMLRYQPGINIDRAGTRFATEGINIRGIGGNRVAMEIDGVPVQSQFSLGSFSNTGRDTLEVETVKRVEILSGPASTLYGSRAIGGVMAVTTLDPEDIVNGNNTYGVRGKSGWYSVDSSWLLAGGAAWQAENTGFLTFYNKRKGNQPENMAATGFANDIQQWDSDSLLSKFVWDSPAGNRFRFIYNGFQHQADTDLRSMLGLGRFASTSKLTAKDSNSSSSISADYDFTTSHIDKALLRVYYQQSSIDQQSSETRPTARTPVQLERRFLFDESITGLELNAFKTLIIGRSIHNIGVGLEFQQNEVREKRDALSINLDTGQISNEILGEVFPTRDFPISTTRETGLFIHDEIELGNSGWRLIPGVRYDYYSLNPRRDTVFDNNNADVEIQSVDDGGFSPKLGMLYRLNSDWSLFGQYAHGFRAPPSQDVNRSLFLPLFKFRVLPNPDLRSETSDGVELGLRQSGSVSSFSATAFWTEYDDFIESAALLGFDPISGEMQFQSRNITRARIYGAELQWQQQLDNWLRGLNFEIGAYWSHGENLDNKQPLNTISPPQLVAGLRWLSADQQFRLGFIATVTASQERIDTTVAERFATPGYGLLDLTAGWRFNDKVQFEAGIFNFLDKKYWRWADVSKFSPDDPIIEVLSRPGRNFSISVKVTL